MVDPGWPHASSPFHPGEIAVQARAGMDRRADIGGRRGIRDRMPDQHRAFFAQLPFLAVGSVDAAGAPWASLLAGMPGFLATPDDRTLAVRALPAPGDPLARTLSPGAPLGLLGIELHTRRRNRLNGRITAIDGQGFTLAVEQSFGNCPQYIQARDFTFVRDPGLSDPGIAGAAATLELDRLDAAAQRAVSGADTLFLASHADLPGGRQVDVSHRGGRPGFVRLEDARTLTFPDYRGNAFFNTLGNIHANGRAGLTFVDFETGDMLLLSGRAEILWDAPEIAAFAGAQRLVRFRLDRGLRRRDTLPLRWRFRDYAPTTLATGSWEEAAAAMSGKASPA